MCTACRLNAHTLQTFTCIHTGRTACCLCSKGPPPLKQAVDLADAYHPLLHFRLPCAPPKACMPRRLKPGRCADPVQSTGYFPLRCSITSHHHHPQTSLPHAQGPGGGAAAAAAAPRQWWCASLISVTNGEGGTSFIPGTCGCRYRAQHRRGSRERATCARQITKRLCIGRDVHPWHACGVRRAGGGRRPPWEAWSGAGRGASGTRRGSRCTPPSISPACPSPAAR